MFCISGKAHGYFRSYIGPVDWNGAPSSLSMLCLHTVTHSFGH